MKTSDIQVGETYLFVATDEPTRKHLEGQPFEVIEKKAVWRRLRKGKRKVYRFFNADGVGARPEELGPMPETDLFCNPIVPVGCNAVITEKYREFPCPNCDTGELIHTSTSPTNHGITLHYECNECGYMDSYP